MIVILKIVKNLVQFKRLSSLNLGKFLIVFIFFITSTLDFYYFKIRYSGTPRSVNGQCTPKTFIPYNPFEPKADLLQLPIVSPSLFKEVVSPSEKEDTEFAWNIDNLAILYPVPIETPGSEMEVPLDPEYEKKAQEAIDK